MNPYLKNLSKIEFVVTDACTGRCRHCSQGDHSPHGTHIDPKLSSDAVVKISSEYEIQTVMTFGGEPLLHPDAVYAIIGTAKTLGIPHRQLITNGYFSKNSLQIRQVAERLSACGVNDLLLSVDAFHQETIPLDTVKTFARAARACGIPVRLSPAWLVSQTDENPYNRKTREILARFADTDIPAGDGNIVFPEGNARRYLAEYFAQGAPKNPYAENPRDVHCLSFLPSGDVLNGNVYERDIMEIIKEYAP